MYVELDLPEVPEPTTSVSTFWQRYLFFESPSQNAQVNALASTYMRLVEASIVDYRLGSSALRRVWSDHNSVGLKAMHRSISHFESCVSGMHRAIAAYRRLRNHPARDPLSVYLADVKPAFISDNIAFRVRNVRDAVHHLEEKVLKGEVAEGQQIALMPDGDEVPHATELGQTIMTYDRLVIGPHQLKFADIATWLSEMAAFAGKVSEFNPRQNAASP